MNPSDLSFRYSRILAKDATFDGQFLTGVHTTGIYCLPSCPARKPKLENVTFFEHESDAIAAGLRPCKRCRPDAFYRGNDWDAQLFQSLQRHVREAPTAVPSVAALAEKAGVSLSKLNDLLRTHAHLRPASWLRRERLHRAQQYLLHGGGKVLDAGLAAGFESEASFHRQFLAATGITPGAYRQLRNADQFALVLPQGYRYAETLAYFSRDNEQLAERVSGHTLDKAFQSESGPAILSIECRPEQGLAYCRLHAQQTLSPADRVAAHRMALRMLGLDNDAAAFEARAGSDTLIARLITHQHGLRPPLTATIFEALVWAIVGQQVNLSFATQLRRTVIARAGHKVAGSHLWLHPNASDVAALMPADLIASKFSRSKADYLLGAAEAVAQGALALDTLRDQSAVLAERSLLALRGIGPWTAAYVMLRGAGFDDCIPVGDSGLTEGLKRFFQLDSRPDADQTRQLLAPFSPHASLATCHLWASLKAST